MCNQIETTTTTSKEVVVQKRASGGIDSSSREMVEVLYDYSGHGVNVRAGELLPLLESTNVEWWKVELKDGRRDYVPASYVKRSQPVTNIFF